MIQVHVTRDQYTGKSTIKSTLKTQDIPFYESTLNDSHEQNQRHWEPIGGNPSHLTFSTS